jgi:hypothetical protein
MKTGIVVLLLLAMACTKKSENNNEALWMTKVQTQCADAWGYGATIGESAGKLKNYLLQKGITVHDIRYVDDKIEGVCLACTCRTNFRFDVSVSEADRAAMLAEGFEQ